MTTTNRAFIKAYRHDAPQPVPASPTLRSSSQFHGASAANGNALASSVEYVSIAAGHVRPAISAFSTTIVQHDSVAATPENGCILGRDSVATAPVALGDFPEATVTPWRIDRQAAPKRPLSAFTPSRPARTGEGAIVRTRSIGSAPPTGAGFQPGTTIASFRWPSVCRALWRESNNDLNRVAQQLLSVSEESRPLVGVIGLFPGAGCTTTLLSLAGPLAARGGRVVVVDANFRAPQLNSLLGVETDTTWQDVLARGLPVGDAIVRAVDDNLDLLPYVPHPANDDPSKLNIGLHASVTAGVLRYAYDVALVDLGAFFAADSQPVLLELVRSMRLDQAIAITSAENADPRDLETLGQYLDESDCKLLGTIENRAA